MQYGYAILAAMLCMSQSRLTGSGQTVYGSYELLAALQGVLLLTAVAGSVIDPETKETQSGNLGLVTIATIEL